MSSFGSPNDKPVAIRQERRSDVAARDSLLDTAFGPGRLAKTSERLREGRKPARGLAFVARRGGHLVGTLRLWPVVTGTGHSGLLLGPLAVAEEARCLGVGAALMRLALQRADLLGHRAVILVGDAAYYSRFGFSAEMTAALRMPGPYERHRLLASELVPGALRGAGGLIAVASPPPSRLSGLMDRIAGSPAPIGQPA
ncbi:GNAT family N-acetyltransferase [Bradyrhizobium sp. CCBAU 53421]|uniref:GNAT family N-acetyltransferase n=1 Tax=Bradyrhizobium sp. CCBAU 53421 TaxID=1325120 RepID=UPI00188B817D|nr:N-acetyltransferase [Bradyrhizobium sp. CCBAU 53421]QOZ36865.1 N-acetyltransferase [Bradyrhizobium sp. CCBAU 53421]